MGFSARYHAASLAAVFFALAIGILIGSQIGGDILNSTRDSLEKSLTSDLDESRSQVDELQGQLKTADEFGNSVYPALVEAQLRGDRVGLVGFGDLPGDVTSSAEDAIDASGAGLVAVGAVREPPSPSDIAASFDKGPFTRLGNNGENSPTMREYGRVAGRQIINGGAVLEATDTELFSQSSGEFGNLDALIVYRGEPDEATPEEADLTADLETGMLEGATSTRAEVVGVEESDANPTSVGFYIDNGISSVDNIDQPAGKVSVIYALAGASGNFGTGEEAERLLPELLESTPASQNQNGNKGGSNGGKQG